MAAAMAGCPGVKLSTTSLSVSGPAAAAASGVPFRTSNALVSCSRGLAVRDDFWGASLELSSSTSGSGCRTHFRGSPAEKGNKDSPYKGIAHIVYGNSARQIERVQSRRGSSVIIVLAQAAEQGSPTNDKQKQVVAITGATGFVGSRLVQRLVGEGHTVRVLTRSADKAKSIFPKKDFPTIEIAEVPEWQKSIEGTTGVVNLAGTPISRRWTEQIKKEIKASRVDATTRVVEAIKATPKDLRPSVFVSGTAVGFYGTSESSAFDETSPSGNDYLAEVCRDWEGKAQDLDGDIRLVRLRTGIVLDKDGGALAQIVPLFRVFAGGPLGSGKQWFSWVHRDDLVSLITEALTNPAYEGALNGTAPNPVRFAELCDRIGSVLGRPSWLPVPEFAVRAILGEGAVMVLEGQRVIPKRAQQLGFTFKYPYVTDALKAILT